MLKAKGLLHQIVINKCYLVLTARDQQEKLLVIKNLRLVKSLIVMLIATLPLLQEGEFKASILVRHAMYIKASIVQLNAQYFILQCQRNKLKEIAMFMCKQQAEKLQQSRQKGVVYCKSKKQCKKLAKKLRCAYYHADVVDQADQLQEWVEQGRIIVATLALGTGVDFASIIYILHVGTLQSISNFA